ncbi:MAG: hypothetical protein EOO74_03620, partial [Myxococcales bacterium]
MSNDEMSDRPEDDDDLPEDDDDGGDDTGDEGGDDEGGDEGGDEPEDDDAGDEDEPGEDEDAAEEAGDEDSDEEPGDEEPGEDEDSDEAEDSDDEDSDDEDSDDEDSDDEDSDDDSDEDESDDDSDDEDSDDDEEDDEELAADAIDEDDDAFETPDAPEDNFEDDQGDWSDEDYIESAHELFADSPFLDEEPEQRYIDEGLQPASSAQEAQFEAAIDAIAPGAFETLMLFFEQGRPHLEGFVEMRQLKKLKKQLPDVDLRNVKVTLSSKKANKAPGRPKGLPRSLEGVDDRDAVDLRKFAPPIGDQGQTNRCAAFAWTHALELVRAIQGQPAVRLSSNFTMLQFQRFMGDADGFEWAYQGGDGTVPG